MAREILSFGEEEVAQILWVLAESLEMADHIDALSTRALIEDVYGMVRRRFHERGPQ